MQWSPHPLTLRQLQYVVAVADERSFHGAATLCRVAQPSLSAQIAQLESALGVRLFERDRRGVVMTAAGLEVVDRARKLLVAADELVFASTRLADPFSGTLRIGVIPTVAPYLLPEIAPALRGRYPNLSFVWFEDKTDVLLTRLAQADLDAAIVATEGAPIEVERAILGKDPFVFAASIDHPLATTTRPIKAEALESENVLLLDDGHCFREQALAFCSRTGAEEVPYRATSLATLVQMVAASRCVTLLPQLAVPSENRRGVLRVRRIAPRGPARTLALVWRKRSALLATLDPVAKTVREIYAQLEPKLAAAVDRPSTSERR